MNCSKCLKPVQENWNRCPVCKTKINATRCPLCNEILLDGWTCCPNCDNLDEELEGAVAADIWHDAPEPYTDDSLPELQKSFRHDRKSREDTLHNSETESDFLQTENQQSFRPDRINLRDGDVAINSRKAEQFTFDRDRNVAHAHYMDEQEVIHEEERSQGRGRPRSHMTQLGLPSQRLTKRG
ncbi:uncharacterized protein LOC127874437 isoform X2 [Dreissena polymorpha]|uniref:uncharacterized protein LOC127874437 isoform X2 n=1 Tax=Dreissena polymorpha TaxID=45954 RepID=UPI002263C75D|nr:uncharacterized protein LOC127874437 isoform X2 [Dreissena polymorpha]